MRRIQHFLLFLTSDTQNTVLQHLFCILHAQYSQPVKQHIWFSSQWIIIISLQWKRIRPIQGPYSNVFAVVFTPSQMTRMPGFKWKRLNSAEVKIQYSRIHPNFNSLKESVKLTHSFEGLRHAAASNALRRSCFMVAVLLNKNVKDFAMCLTCACCRWWWRSGHTQSIYMASHRCAPTCGGPESWPSSDTFHRYCTSDLKLQYQSYAK